MEVFKILHEKALESWELVCQIWCSQLKPFGHSVKKYPRVSRNAKFWDLFFQLWNIFQPLRVIVPLWNFGIRLLHFIWISKSIFTKLAGIFFIFFKKMSKIKKCKILKNFKSLGLIVLEIFNFEVFQNFAIFLVLTFFFKKWKICLPILLKWSC